jgi:hypothetical protein
MDNTDIEDIERNKTLCIGCDDSKDIGLVVCWSCFKHSQHPYKFFDGTLLEWLEVINK